MLTEETSRDGFHRLLTRAPMVDSLAASPANYDAAPTYLVDAYRRNTSDLQQKVAKQVESSLTEQVRGNTATAQAKLMAEVGAPAMLDSVRTLAVMGLAKNFVLTANPALALMTAPVIFFTGKKTLSSLKRSLKVDPEVREHIDAAKSLSDRGNYRAAESRLKEALELDISPEYRRNGDLYLHLGMVQLQDDRPREAMISLARASVLFDETDTVNLTDEEHSVSKRGVAELFTCVAIDSFAKDLEGLREWDSIVSDFAESAVERLETVAARQEEGRLLGMFGVDRDSAEFGRDLIAKIRFLAAKMKLRSASARDDGDIDNLLRTGVEDLKQAALSEEELCLAILQQAQFYSEITLSSDESVTSAAIRRVMYLFEQAATALDETDSVVEARLRAEAASFAVAVIPRAVADGVDVSELRERVLQNLDEIGEILEAASHDWEYAALARGWAEEQKVRLRGDRDGRYDAAQRAHRTFVTAGEPVAAMQNALRMAYFADGEEQKEEAVAQLVDGTRRVLEGNNHPVTRAFAAKYFLDSGAATGSEESQWTRQRSAELFLEAAEHVRSERVFTAFYLNGKPVIHPWRVAELVLRGQAAEEFERAGQLDKARRLYEKVRVTSEDAAGCANQALDLEYGELLMEMGRLEEARETLESTLRQARQKELSGLQHRALELIHQIEETNDAKLISGDDDQAGESEEADQVVPRNSELMGKFAARRRRLVEVGRETIDTIEDSDVFRHGDALPNLVERLEGRLERLEEGRFRIGIVGEFSAGKSTFLNALLGERLLPSSIRPTTATVVRMRWGDEPKVTVSFDGEEAEPIEFDDLAEFATERQNPSNEKEVVEVLIEYPLPLLENGVELIDSPGVSSLIEAHTETTHDLIPTCDAVILFATGRQPFSESIGQFFEELRLVVEGKVFYVVNKIDQLEPEDREQALEFAEKRVEEHVEGARVLPLSAYQALTAKLVENGDMTTEEAHRDPRAGEFDDIDELLTDSHLGELETGVENFLEQQRGLPLLREVGEEFTRAQNEALRTIEVELETAQMNHRQKRKKHQKLLRSHQKRRSEVEEQLEQMERDLHEAVEEIVARPQAELPEFADEIVRKAHLTLDDLESETSRAEFKERVGRITRRKIDDYVKDLSDELSKSLAWYQMDAREKLRDFQEELQAEFRSTLSLPEPDVDSNVSLQNVQRLDVRPELSLDTYDLVGHSVVGGVLGFVGTMLMGPIGLGLAGLTSYLGGSELSSHLAKQKLPGVREELERDLRKSLNELGEELTEQLRETAQEISDAGVETIHELATEIHDEFDAQLNLLIEEEEDDEEERLQQMAELREIRETIEEMKESTMFCVT